MYQYYILINKFICQDCYCGGKDIPGGFTADQIPQFVLLTFDDAVNDLNKQFYEDLFGGRFNPNGCPIKSTFYVSHEWTDYAQVCPQRQKDKDKNTTAKNTKRQRGKETKKLTN